MTFTYDPGSPDDITRVRFHLGDTDEAAAILTDEEISFAIDMAGGWEAAVIACIQTIIGRLAGEPDFRADWLSVDSSEALDTWRQLLAEKRREFGISRVRSQAKTTYRPDSYQTGGDYSESDPYR